MIEYHAAIKKDVVIHLTRQDSCGIRQVKTSYKTVYTS